MLLALAFVAGTAGPTAALLSTEPLTEPRAAGFARTSFYPIGWWDSLEFPERLPGMRSGGMNTVLPYTGLTHHNVGSYLDLARKHGLKVFVQIDPVAIMTANPLLVRSFVELYRSHPSVYGWLLADEPTIHPEYELLTPAVAELLYQQIKAADSKRPVGIAFGVSENPRPYLRAMDVLLYDDYVTDAGKPEFHGLWAWRNRLEDRAKIASKLKGYIPILQAFGQDSAGRPQITKRLPTTNEMRYLTYSAIQHNSTGIFFWVRYRSRSDWVSKVMTPLSKEIAPASRAFAYRPVSGASVVEGKGMKATLFRDPVTKVNYLVLVNHLGGKVTAKVKISSSLKVKTASSKFGKKDISGGQLIDSFGPYAARLYRLY